MLGDKLPLNIKSSIKFKKGYIYCNPQGKRIPRDEYLDNISSNNELLLISRLRIILEFELKLYMDP